MYHVKLGPVRDSAEALNALSAEIGDWVKLGTLPDVTLLSKRVYAPAFHVSGWVPWLIAHPDHPKCDALFLLVRQIRQHYESNDTWKRGYWRMMEVGMGTHHFCHLLTNCWQLDSEKPDLIADFLDAASHIGNKNPETPAWFDWDRGAFHSIYLGTEGAKEPQHYDINLPVHARFVEMALTAYRMGGGTDFLDLADAHGQQWARAILASGDLPLGLQAGEPVYRLKPFKAGLYRQFGILQDASNYSRAVAMLNANMVQTLMLLWQLKRDGAYLKAAERLLDLLLPGLEEVDCNALVAALRYYRNHSGKSRYDSEILNAVEHLFPYFIGTLDLELAPTLPTRDRDLGYTDDMPNWRENGMIRQHNPLLMGLAAEISGNHRLLSAALNLGRAYLRLSRRAFTQGTDNPESARNVSAVALGHLHDNHAGIVNELWAPLRAHMNLSSDRSKKSRRRLSR